MKRLNFTLIFLFFAAFAFAAKDSIHVVILHTNDTHSQVEPTAVSYLETSDMGGYARRMGVIEQIRSEEKNVLLFDAGDMFQGTPYFNFFKGRIEIDAMNKMKYDAGTLGNHEFDNGMDTLAAVLKNAKFPIITSNYDMDDTPLKDMVMPYYIMERFGLKIGVMALGVNPYSLIAQKNYKGMYYNNPVMVAQLVSKFLKTDMKCDLVICLSHLGSVKSLPVNDFIIAQNTKYIDVIIGGHSHTQLPDGREKNQNGKTVVISQMGKSGLYLGRIDLTVVKKM